MYLGKHGLKDSFAAMIGTSYDLRAPDYSYLVIIEIRDFYYTKVNIFSKCKKVAIQMSNVVRSSKMLLRTTITG